MEFGPLISAADALHRSATDLPAQATEVKTLSGQLYNSWDKVLVDMETRGMGSDAVLDMGWGRLVFGQTFDDLGQIVDALRAEESGRRDICVSTRKSRPSRDRSMTSADRSSSTTSPSRPDS